MGMGQRSECNLCEFVFFSGHSHHTGVSGAVCTSCLTEFALPTQSSWGPEIGEMIFLNQVVRDLKARHKKRPPIVTYRYEPTDEFLIAESAGAWGVVYPISHIRCPCCQKSGSLVLDFKEGQDCPKCHDGVLHCGQVLY